MSQQSKSERRLGRGLSSLLSQPVPVEPPRQAEESGAGKNPKEQVTSGADGVRAEKADGAGGVRAGSDGGAGVVRTAADGGGVVGAEVRAESSVATFGRENAVAGGARTNAVISKEGRAHGAVDSGVHGGDAGSAGEIGGASPVRAREGVARESGGASDAAGARAGSGGGDASGAHGSGDAGVGQRARAGGASDARGVDARGADEGEVVERLLRIPLAQIVTSRHQPRKVMDESALKGLADSIRVSGVMQPVAVREAGAGLYELVAGERRWRASKIAGLSAIPAVVVRLSDEESAAWGLVENMQREDLNPMERAEGLKRLSEEFGLSHGQVAERVGLERSTVANLVRLVELEEEIRDRVASGALTAGHGKALLSVPAGKARKALANRCESAGWSVRRLEATIAAGAYEGSPGGVRIDDTSDVEETRVGGLSRAQAQARDLEKRLGEHLGTRVRIRTDASGKRGRVMLEFYDLDHFEGLMEKMGFKGGD